MHSCREGGDLREQFQIEVALEATPAAIAGRGASELVAKESHAGQAHDAAVGASQGTIRLVAQCRDNLGGLAL